MTNAKEARLKTFKNLWFRLFFNLCFYLDIGSKKGCIYIKGVPFNGTLQTFEESYPKPPPLDPPLANTKKQFFITNASVLI